MGKFKLKEKKIDVRGTAVHIRELTHKERLQIAQKTAEDKFGATALMISLAVTDPKMTEEEVAAESGEVTEQIVTEIMNISGMGAKQKNPDAG